ncbi:MAG: CvpA family protein [Candidatus Omnitrophota bacterium]
MARPGSIIGSVVFLYFAYCLLPFCCPELSRMSVNFTDVTFLTIIAVLTIIGYFRGLLRTVVGPVSFGAALLVAFFLYQKTHNPIITLSVGLFGPVFLGAVINTIINHTIMRNKIPEPSTLSRITGAAFNCLWGSIICLTILAGLIVMPLDAFRLGDINNNARGSITYALLRKPFASKGIISSYEAQACVSGVCTMSEKDQNKLAADKDVQEIMNDPRVLRLMASPAIQGAIDAQDYTALFSNPIVMELGQDPEFLAKALRVYPKIKAMESR